MLDAQAALEASDPQSRPLDIELVAPHLDGLIATSNTIHQCGAVPVFVDIDPATFNIVPAGIEEAVSSKTSAILCVHQMGMPCDMRAIMQVARAHGLQVVEDAACAVGSSILRKDGPISTLRSTPSNSGAASMTMQPRTA